MNRRSIQAVIAIAVLIAAVTLGTCLPVRAATRTTPAPTAAIAKFSVATVHGKVTSIVKAKSIETITVKQSGNTYILVLFLAQARKLTVATGNTVTVQGYTTPQGIGTYSLLAEKFTCANGRTVVLAHYFSKH